MSKNVHFLVKIHFGSSVLRKCNIYFGWSLEIQVIYIKKGYGGLYVENGDELEQIYHFKGNKTQHRLTLLPGRYRVVFRAKSSKNHIYTTEKSFKLRSGQSELIKIY